MQYVFVCTSINRSIPFMKSMRSRLEEAFAVVAPPSTGDSICCSRVHPDESELVSENGLSTSRPKHPNFSASELPVRIESRSSSLSVSHDFCKGD